ncbi:MAG: SAM-dependent methyltransferase, partial [Parafilimonas sp.]
MQATIYLIPITLYDDEMALNCIPSYIIDAVKKCTVFYAENERTSRRFLKKIFKEINIDAYEWHTIHKAENEVLNNFKKDLIQQKTVGIMSEAGCPGIADPGQILINIAQQMDAKVIPLVGPNSIILALMASGMNGQSFQFVGYL